MADGSGTFSIAIGAGWARSLTQTGFTPARLQDLASPHLRSHGSAICKANLGPGADIRHSVLVGTAAPVPILR